ncbi:stress response translation initiation inhibitor YciH [filamentous cyanobacterium CCP1]|nr:stress response translation initiation inhibitor YciH [filamentous cyanobacterium CCP2]PSB57947.1 stress response translation initiation inhibitor YciH [filamentous cyanobacterium CCP1]
MGSKRKAAGQGNGANRVVYSEFGHHENADATERPIAELPPNQQNLRVQASRKGRKGKTVTVISGFQAKPETLADILKKLKTQCGAGGTIEENEILIQGDHAQKLVQLLVQMGYKAKVSGGKG